MFLWYKMVHFKVGLHHGIEGVVHRILPLCSHYSIVTRFMQHYTKYSVGMVSNYLITFNYIIAFNHLQI